MGTDELGAASNPGSPAEGASMISEETVIRFLNTAPSLPCPDDILARLRTTIADEVELRRASRVEPDADLPELKAETPLWINDSVLDD
jgi:hypothetical protein